MAPDEGLRLRAEDAEDVSVISACLQDALVAVRDLVYDTADRSFVLTANRFRWESAAGMPRLPERTLCVIAFGEVDAVAYRGFQRNEEERILCLLAICPRLDGRGGTIDLEFCDGASVRLSVSRVRMRARDVGEPWPTARQPRHRLDEGQ